VSVHYLEEMMLPFVEVVRNAVYGDQSYTSALSGCEKLDPKGDWVHPAALALTVYGDAQAALEAAFGPHGPEVLPGYAAVRRGEHELRCVANYLIAVSRRESLGGRNVRSFQFEIPHAKYDLEIGWVSGLAQGVVGQVFLGYYLVSGEQQYLVAAREVGQLLDVDISDGGVKVVLPTGGTWYEEYAQRGAKPPLVLNGHLLAMDFLYWMNQVEEESGWDVMFSSGMKAVVDEIDSYRGLAWSSYDQESNLATRKYHSFHVRQLDRYSMHDQSGLLADASNEMRWQLFVPFGVLQRLVTQPSRLLLFLLGIFFVVYFPVAWFIYSKRRSPATVAPE
jgi:hypothetical protein